MSTRDLRRLGAVVLGSTLIAATLSGCSKEADGAVAIGRDAQGEVIVQIVTCEYPATELDLLLEQEGAEPQEDVSAAPLDQPAGTSQTYTLPQLFGESRSDLLDSAAPYQLRGTVADDGGERDMNGVSFTLDQVAGYQPDQVISNDLDSPVSVEAFTSQACEDGAPASEKPR
ncbi:hypothetical protein [Ruania zhangjianzhongii]|uniref:hypothetical protein n=1 Tax=Ruania zhangjianzhongii TaxID=2603206 RepID=UPI0011CCADD3|nr:hypothetical protein [Ruania zhangjianzhongii]